MLYLVTLYSKRSRALTILSTGSLHSKYTRALFFLSSSPPLPSQMPPDPVYMYVAWGQGTDTAVCGRTSDAPCRSLQQAHIPTKKMTKQKSLHADFIYIYIRGVWRRL